jgi:hypothetical protein
MTENLSSMLVPTGATIATWRDQLELVYGGVCSQDCKARWAWNQKLLALKLLFYWAHIHDLNLYFKKISIFFQAETILNITHGQSHPKYQELLELTAQCQEEMRVTLEHSGDTWHFEFNVEILIHLE